MADRIKLRDARSFTMVYNDFFRMPQKIISYYDKLVFIAIKSHAGLSGSSFPSINLLHRETGISRQKIQDSVAHLEELGFLRKEKRQSTVNRGNISNLYTIYETEEMCRAGTPEAVKKAAETSEEDKAIETLRRLGYTVTPPGGKEKEQSDVGASDRSDDKIDSLPESYLNLSHEKLQAEKYTLDQIREMMHYDLMVSDNPDQREFIDAAIHVIYTAVNTSKPTLRVGQEDKPSSVVISQLLKLDHIKIMDCIDSIFQAGKPIQNPEAYLRTTLYNSATQSIKIASRATYNMAQWHDKDKQNKLGEVKPPEHKYDFFDND